MGTLPNPTTLVDVKDLVQLHAAALQSGKVGLFASVLLEWAQAASDEVARLREVLQRRDDNEELIAAASYSGSVYEPRTGFSFPTVEHLRSIDMPAGDVTKAKDALPDDRTSIALDNDWRIDTKGVLDTIETDLVRRYVLTNVTTGQRVTLSLKQSQRVNAKSDSPA